MTARYHLCGRCGSPGTAYGVDLPRGWEHVYAQGDYCHGCARALRELAWMNRPPSPSPNGITGYCKNHHPQTPRTTYVDYRGNKACRECRREKKLRHAEASA